MNAILTSSVAAPSPLRTRLAGLDRPLLATGLLLAGLGLLAPRQFLDTVGFVSGSALSIAPFLLGSVLAAGWLRAAGADRLIGSALRARPGRAIVLAALLGALSPFCSCGVIPVISALLLAGVPLAPVMAFWVASPIMAPDMYLITAGTLGFEFATAKALAAVAIGLVAGGSTALLGRSAAFADPLRQRTCSSCSARALPDGPLQWRFWTDADRRRQFAADIQRNAAQLGKWLLVAFVLESLMLAWLPADALAGVVGDHGWAIPLAALIGVPTYLNGYAAVPLVAGLIDSGMAPGAALTFMTAGAMTSVPAALAVYSLVRRRVFGWYLLLALLLSMAAGHGYAAWLG